MKVVPLIPSSVNFATRLSIPRLDKTFRQWPRRRSASPKQAFEDEAVVDRWIELSPVAWIFTTRRLCFRRFHRAEAWISRVRSHFSSASGGCSRASRATSIRQRQCAFSSSRVHNGLARRENERRARLVPLFALRGAMFLSR